MLDETTHLIDNPLITLDLISSLSERLNKPMKTLDDLGIPVSNPWQFPPQQDFFDGRVLERGFPYLINLNGPDAFLYLRALDIRQIPSSPDTFATNIVTLVYASEFLTSLYGITVIPITHIISSAKTFTEWLKYTSLVFEGSDYEPYVGVRTSVLSALASELANDYTLEKFRTTGGSRKYIRMLRVTLKYDNA